jgi:hypothetical protein
MNIHHLLIPLRLRTWLVMGCLLLAGVGENLAAGIVIWPVAKIFCLAETVIFALRARRSSPCLN